MTGSYCNLCRGEQRTTYILISQLQNFQGTLDCVQNSVHEHDEIARRRLQIELLDGMVDTIPSSFCNEA
jgi:hypothetical protein